MPLTNPPFTRQPNTPPLHLRDLEPDEMAQWQRMRESYERLSSPKPQEAKTDESKL